MYWGERFFQEGFFTDTDYMLDVQNTREALAVLIGCSSSDIAFFTNTSNAISQFAFNCNLNDGDEVLMWDQEYTSHLYPWQEACKRSKSKLTLVKSDANLYTDTQKFIDSITPKTRIVAFSWVQFSSGAQMKTMELIQECKKRNILVFVDVMQGLGVLECHLWEYGADAIAGGSHKWLTSPVGVGFLALRKNLAISMRPNNYGAYTFGTCEDPTDLSCIPKSDVTRFESGSKQVLEISALGASCRMISECGIQAINNEAIRLAKYLDSSLQKIGIETLNPNGSVYLSPIVNFRSSNDSKNNQLIEVLKTNSVSFALRGGGIRLAPHAFNTEKEIDFVVSILESAK